MQGFGVGSHMQQLIDWFGTGEFSLNERFGGEGNDSTFAGFPEISGDVVDDVDGVVDGVVETVEVDEGVGDEVDCSVEVVVEGTVDDSVLADKVVDVEDVNGAPVEVIIGEEVLSIVEVTLRVVLETVVDAVVDSVSTAAFDAAVADAVVVD